MRTTVSGHQYVATSVVDDLASHCAASSVDLDVVCRLLTKHHKDHAVAIQVGLYATTRSFFLIECSEDKNAMNIELRPDENELACAAYSMLPASRQARILEKCCLNNDTEKLKHFRRLVHRNRASLHDKGYVLDAAGESAYIWFETETETEIGQAGAVSITLKSASDNLEFHAQKVSERFRSHQLQGSGPEL